jgi:hypothetical protein
LNLPLIEEHQIKDLVGVWTKIGQGGAQSRNILSFFLISSLPSAFCPLPSALPEELVIPVKFVS